MDELGHSGGAVLRWSSVGSAQPTVQRRKAVDVCPLLLR